MARDFRPKAARGKRPSGQARQKKGEQSATGANSVVQASTAKPRREWKGEAAAAAPSSAAGRDEQDSSSSEDNVDDETLLKEIKSMGGDKQDLDLIRKRGKGKAKASRDDDEAEEDVSGLLFTEGEGTHKLRRFRPAGGPRQ